jgi:hypothetical protein
MAPVRNGRVLMNEYPTGERFLDIYHSPSPISLER